MPSKLDEVRSNSTSPPSFRWRLAKRFSILSWRPVSDEAPADEAREAGSVAPAKRSTAALAKAQNRRLADGTPAFSFRGLLKHLATIVRNTMRRKDAGPGEGTFTLTTEPNAKQRQALDLAATIAV